MGSAAAAGAQLEEEGPQAGPAGFPPAAPSPQQGRAASSGCLGCVCGQTGRNQPVRNLRNDTAGQWGSGGGERAAQKRSEPASRAAGGSPAARCLRACVRVCLRESLRVHTSLWRVSICFYILSVYLRATLCMDACVCIHGCVHLHVSLHLELLCASTRVSV